MRGIQVWFCAVLFAACAAMAADKVIRNVSVEEFAKLAGNKTNLVLDVRTPKEYSAGHIPGAKLIDFNAPDFEEKIAGLDKSKTYLIHCAAGGRSAKACKQMEGLGFTNLINLAPGFRGWEKAGKPVEK
jgi:rhodanese-related sulfurtransferase